MVAPMPTVPKNLICGINIVVDVSLGLLSAWKCHLLSPGILESKNSTLAVLKTGQTSGKA